MRELALHILDVAENGIAAGADCIQICIDEARLQNILTIVIKDDGSGISEEMVPRLTDPFVTTRTTRRIGLGLPLLEATATRCDGQMTIESEPGKGTKVKATFRYDHIDRAPLGDIAGTLTTLIAGNPDVDFIYTHKVNDNTFKLDMRDIRKLSDRSTVEPHVVLKLARSINQALNRLEQT